MADKSINELKEANELLDDGMTVVYQLGQTLKIAGSALKAYARKAVEPAVQEANTAAGAAQTAQKAAENAQNKAENAQAATETARDNALASANAAKNAQNAAEDAQNAAENAQESAETAEAFAHDYANAAKESENNAAASEFAAAQSEANAKTARNASEAAQKAAESARDATLKAKADAEKSAQSAADSALSAQQYSGKPNIIRNGNWWVWDFDIQEYKDTGERAVLNYDTSFSSFDEMVSKKDEYELNTVAIISSSVEEEDNAKTYIRDDTDENGWRFLSDLSGFTGVGFANQVSPPNAGAPGQTDVYTFNWTDGRQTTFKVYNGRNGEGSGDVLGISFTITIPKNGWKDGSNTVNDSRFLSADRYNYFFSGAAPKSNRDEYDDCHVQADSIPSDGVVVFTSDVDPDSDLIVYVARLEMSNNGTNI